MGKTQKIVGLILMLVALGLAAYAWMVSNRIAEEQKAAQPKMLPVVVAKTRIPAGSVIKQEMLQISMFPSRPASSYADINNVAGKIAGTDIAADEAILKERLGDGLRSLLQHIDPNQRAVAIRVDEVIAVGNKLIPGDMVDIFFTLHRNSNEIQDTQSRLLLENLQVLAFGSWDVGGAKPSGDEEKKPRSSEKPKTAVLAVKTEDIDKLVLAGESGRLILALRPHESPQEVLTITAADGTTKPVTSNVQSTTPPLTLKQLIAMTKGVQPDTGKTVKSRNKRSTPHPVSETVIVMHGLDEKKVTMASSNGTKP